MHLLVIDFLICEINLRKDAKEIGDSISTKTYLYNVYVAHFQTV